MMKIVIKEKGRPKTIRLPNFLLTRVIGKNWLKNKYHVDLDRSQMKQIAKALAQFKKQYDLPLVEAISQDSEIIVWW